MSKPVIMIGNGGHASVLAEILLTKGEEILGFTAPQEEKNLFSIPYLGADESILNYSPKDIDLVLGLGMVRPSPIRQHLFNHFSSRDFQIKTVIHPSAIIAPSVQLGQGVQIMAGVIIQTNTIIADNSIINTGTLIDHDCQIGAHVHIAPGVNISGQVHIQNGTHIGTGATIIQGMNIGTNCLIGAGAVVVKHIADNRKAVGVPAKEV
ncbi:acetyltransferase [Lysinibacillus sp. OTC-L20]|uniref:acetyltransferase n=1 Tax=Lysinibacillus sp. OTC-L20 TaxID=3342791 RepID=UPI0035B7BE07